MHVLFLDVLEAIASRLEAIALRLEAIAIVTLLDVCAVGSRCCCLCPCQLLLGLGPQDFLRIVRSESFGNLFPQPKGRNLFCQVGS